MLYKGRRIGKFILDLIAFNPVIVDAKVIDRITDVKRGQMLKFTNHTAPRRRQPQLQESETGVGAPGSLIRVHLCPFVVS